MNFLTDKYSNFCAACGGFNNFSAVSDSAQKSTWIISGDSSFTTTRVGLSDVSRFVKGNIVKITGNTYSGNFEVLNVIAPVGSRVGSIVLKTKFLKTNAKQDSSYTYGYVDFSEHMVSNLTMFNPLVLQYAETIRNTKGEKGGGDDSDVFSTLGLDVNGTGVLQVIYRRLKSELGKDGISVAEYKYLKTAADTAISTIDKIRKRTLASSFFVRYYTKLQNSSVLIPTTSTDGTAPVETTNESPVAVAERTGGVSTDDSVGSVSGSSIMKYAFIGIALIGGIFLIRSIVKKQ